MYKLGFKVAEESEIKLPTFLGSLRKQRSSRKKTSTSASIDCDKPLTVWITTNWRILKDMGVPDHLICLVRNLYVGQEGTVRTGHETTDWFKMGKEYNKVVYCHLVHLTYLQRTSCKIPGWMNHKVESKLL